jgi:hypothetical protein
VHFPEEWNPAAKCSFECSFLLEDLFRSTGSSKFPNARCPAAESPNKGTYPQCAESSGKLVWQFVLRRVTGVLVEIYARNNPSTEVKSFQRTSKFLPAVSGIGEIATLFLRDSEDTGFRSYQFVARPKSLRSGIQSARTRAGTAS